MGKAKRKPKVPADSWVALQAKFLFPEQELYEMARPWQLEDRPIPARAVEVGKDPKTVRRVVQRFFQFGIPGLVPTTGQRVDDGRLLPLEVRQEIWSVDLRYVEQHQCHDHTGFAYVISIWDNYSRDLLSSGLFRTQDLTSYLVVLHDALMTYGAP